MRGRTVLCKLSWVIEVQGIGSVDVFSFARKFLKQLSLRKETAECRVICGEWITCKITVYL